MYSLFAYVCGSKTLLKITLLLFTYLNKIHQHKRLIEELNNGDCKAFEFIYKNYFKPLTRYASQFVSIEEAENLVQETMTWLWENKGDIDKNRSLQAFLYTIVKNRCLNSISHNQVRRKVFENIIKESTIQYELYEDSENSAIIKQYKELLKSMPSKFQEAFLLNREAKLTHNEIADKLSVSPQTVNYRISQALKYLRNGLSDFLLILILFLENIK